MKTTCSLSTLLLFLFFFRANAQQWERVTVLPATQMSAIHVQGDRLFVAGLNKIYFSNDQGISWDSTSVIESGLDYITGIRMNHGRLYVSTIENGVWVSADFGQTWQASNNGLNGLGALAVAGIEVRGDSLYAATLGSGVFVKNTATNSNWSSYNWGIPWSNIESITNIEGKLFAGAGGNCSFSWQTGANHAWTETVFAEFNGDSNHFLGVIKQDDVLIATGTYGIYRSTDDGATWTRFIPGTGILGAGRFAVAGDRLYALLVKPSGTAFIKYTDDGGLSWHNFQPALTGSTGFDLTYLNGYLFAARSNGLWKIPLVTPVAEPDAALPELNTNYPNPFSGTTTIPFVLPASGKVMLSVYDVSGALVATVFNGTLPAGKHEIEWNSGNLPAGSYVYCITTESGIASKMARVTKN